MQIFRQYNLSASFFRTKLLSFANVYFPFHAAFSDAVTPSAIPSAFFGGNSIQYNGRFVCSYRPSPLNLDLTVLPYMLHLQ